MITLHNLVKSWLAEKLDHFSIDTQFDKSPDRQSLVCNHGWLIGQITDTGFEHLTSHGMKVVEATNPDFFSGLLEKELHDIHECLLWMRPKMRRIN